MVSAVRTVAIIVLLVPHAAAARAQAQAPAAEAPQTTGAVDTQALVGRIDLVRQHYASSRVAGARLELSGTLDLIRVAREAESARPSAGRGGQLPRGGRDVPMPGLLKRVEPVYPIEAAVKGVAGYVVVDAVIDKSGKVRDARIERSVPELDRAALDAVRQWRFAGSTFNGAPADIAVTVALAFTLRRQAPPTEELDLARFYLERGDYASAEPPLVRALETITREAACVAAVSVAAGAQRKTGVGPYEPPRKIKDAKPVYPTLAQKARVTGAVVIDGIIGVDGRVQCPRVVKSVPLLDQAALDAVSQWEFTPVLVAGTPVPTRLTMSVNFTLH